MASNLHREADEFFINFRTAIENEDYSELNSYIATYASTPLSDASGNSILHLAASISRAYAVEQIIGAGIDVNARNQRHETPLHLAAVAPNADAQDTIKLLLRRGANIDARESSGETALHCAARVGNGEVVRTLLGAGADATVMDGRGLMAGEVAIRGGKTGIAGVFSEKRVLDLRRNARHNRPQNEAAAKPQQPPSEPSEGREVVCEYFKGFAWFWDERRLLQRPEVSVWDMLYARGEEPAGATIETESCMRWYHLPDTNLQWIEHLVEKICFDDRAPEESPVIREDTRYEGRLPDHKYKTDADCRHIKEFIVESFHEVGRQIPHRYPGLTASPPKDNSELISLVMPLIDTSLSTSFTAQLRRDKHKILLSSKGTEYSAEKAQWLASDPLPRLLKDFDMQDNLQVAYSNAVVHRERTLDQSYYESMSPETFESRDVDQVFAKCIRKWENGLPGSEKSRGKAPVAEMVAGQLEAWGKAETSTGDDGIRSTEGKEPLPVLEKSQNLKQSSADLERGLASANLPPSNPPLFRTLMLTVPQLWLWKIDSRTIITALPQTPNKNTSSTINRIQRGFPLTVNIDDVMEHILNICTSSTESEVFVQESLSVSINAVFATTIADLASAVRRSYQKFSSSIGSASQTIQEELRREIQLLKEIDNVLDEINMIKRVLRDQKRVASQIFSRTKAEDEDDKIDESETLELRALNYFNRLEDDAERVRDSITTLLDLRQKEATIDEALSSSWQSKVLFVFTLTTVLYAPLAFASALLALPIRGFHEIFNPVWVVKVLVWTTVATSVLIWILLLLRTPLSNTYNYLSRLPSKFLIKYRERHQYLERKRWLKEYRRMEERWREQERIKVEEFARRKEQEKTESEKYMAALFTGRGDSGKQFTSKRKKHERRATRSPQYTMTVGGRNL